MQQNGIAFNAKSVESGPGGLVDSVDVISFLLRNCLFLDLTVETVVFWHSPPPFFQWGKMRTVLSGCFPIHHAANDYYCENEKVVGT